MRTPRQVQRRNLFILFSVIIILVLAIAAIATAIFSPSTIPRLLRGNTPIPNPTVHPGNTPNTTNSSSGIGVIMAPDGEMIGVSDGTYAFDTNRPDGDLKSQAAAALRKGDVAGAVSDWQKASASDTSDAEALIYLEDQQVHPPYVTFVVGTVLTGNFFNIGRDSLQGAYVAQKEHNDQCMQSGCVPIRLLIANSGSGQTASTGTTINGVAYASLIMQQIVRARQADKTIVGVMGWPTSSSLAYATTVLGSAKIPVVSPSASVGSSTALQGSSYIFSVAPSNTLQGQAAASYAEQHLRHARVVLLVDPVDPYSQSLADAFQQPFTTAGNTILATENYRIGNSGSITVALQGALRYNPDLIYFAGHENDVATLLENLPACSSANTCVQVLGGDALYELGGVQNTPAFRAALPRVHFTAFAYPDEWDNLAPSAQKPAFFGDYIQAFNPTGAAHPNPYGYTRADDVVMLSYDAMHTLSAASDAAFTTSSQSFSPGSLQQHLSAISGAQVLQGVSGSIAFGTDGTPTHKAILVLYFDTSDFIHMDASFSCGSFLNGSTTGICG